jgi:hypothetical protein
MGGFGSGWHRGKRMTVEDGWTLSAAKLMRDGMIRPGRHWRGQLTWRNTETGEEVSTIGFESVTSADSGTAWLRYTRSRTGEKAVLEVALTTTPLPWGGRRWWFTCPLIIGGRECRRRLVKLYLPPGAKYFGCRHCYGLTYTSCQESHKYDSIYRKIGWDVGLSPAKVRKLLWS